MTDKERTGTALALALFFHFILLRQDIMKNIQPRGAILVTVTMESLPLPVSGHQPGISLNTLPHSDSEANTADLRRKVFLQFLEAISQEIHNRRLENGGMDLIGVAIFSFQVDQTGLFSQINLTQTSGKPELDASAKRAVERASGIIKRHPILGADPIPVLLEVKYQHGL